MAETEKAKLIGRSGWLRRFNRKVTNPLMMTFAGRRVYTILEHVGRRSKKPYRTPVLDQPAGGEFFIPLPYGKDTDWCLNVLAAGGCTAHWQGISFDLTSPQIVEASVGEAVYTRLYRFLLRTSGVKQYLLLQKTEDRKG